MSSVQSPTASAFRRATFTDAQNALAAKLNALIDRDPVFKGMELHLEKPMLREGETRPNGSPKSYVCDILLFDPKVGLGYDIEAMGEGSSSDDPQRHAFMVAHGLVPLYYDNADIKSALHLVARDIRLKVRLMRILLG